MFTFPAERPDQSPSFLWSIQQQLLQEAQVRLGSKDPTKSVYQPTFSDAGPRIINTPVLDGAFADLSLNAAGYWPTAVYELAHETVHLLDPISGNTNVLEEGVAETFALEMAATGAGELFTSSLLSYTHACNTVKSLGSDVYGSARRIRAKSGALNRATGSDISFLFPEAAAALIQELTSQFERT